MKVELRDIVKNGNPTHREALHVNGELVPNQSDVVVDRRNDGFTTVTVTFIVKPNLSSTLIINDGDEGLYDMPLPEKPKK